MQRNRSYISSNWLPGTGLCCQQPYVSSAAASTKGAPGLDPLLSVTKGRCPADKFPTPIRISSSAGAENPLSVQLLCHLQCIRSHLQALQ
jgi:hypothetical protein